MESFTCTRYGVMIMGRGVFSGEQAIFLLAKTAAHAASIDEGFAFCLLGRRGGGA